MVSVDYFQPFSERGCYPGSFEEEAVQAFLFEVGAVPVEYMSPTVVKLIHEEMRNRFDEICAKNERKEFDREYLRQCISHFRHYRRERNNNLGMAEFAPKQLEFTNL